jgi:hypothetical protein
MGTKSINNNLERQKALQESIGHSAFCIERNENERYNVPINCFEIGEIIWRLKINRDLEMIHDFSTIVSCYNECLQFSRRRVNCYRTTFSDIPDVRRVKWNNCIVHSLTHSLTCSQPHASQVIKPTESRTNAMLDGNNMQYVCL